MIRPEGLHPFHIGFVVGDAIFPPGEFAIAWAGEKSPTDLEHILDTTLGSLGVSGKDMNETPFLSAYDNKMLETEGRHLSLDDLRGLTEKKFGSTKLIDREAVTISDGGHKGTVSVKDTVVGSVASRRKGQEQRDYRVTLYSPFIKEPGDIYRFQAKGGTPHEEMHVAKGVHWSFGLKHESGFVRSIAKQVDDAFKERRVSFIGDEVMKDYTGSLTVIGYARAALLTSLYQAEKAGSLSFKGRDKERKVLMPYDFDNAPHLALEALVRFLHVPGKKGLALPNDPRQGMAMIDGYFIGKKGFITPLFRELYSQGMVRRGVMVAHKKLTNYSWAVIQAFEEHCYLRNRRFEGFALEFPGTPYQTVSIVFGNRMEEKSVRILYDDHFKRPYILYKDYAPHDGFARRHHLNVDPLLKANLSVDIWNRRFPVKTWVEEADHYSGRKALCHIREPTGKILERAHDHSTIGLFQGIKKKTLKADYIKIMQDARMQ